MTLSSSFDETQRKAATLVGVAYLLFQAPAIFAEFYVPAQLFNRADMGETARNIIAHQPLYRLGIASDLIVCVVNVALIAGLYMALRPVNRIVAILAAFLRLIETAILVVAALNDMALVRALAARGATPAAFGRRCIPSGCVAPSSNIPDILGRRALPGGRIAGLGATPELHHGLLGDANYVRTLEVDRLADVTRLAITAHRDIYGIALLFLGLGSAMFCCLWYRSRYVPRALAAWGVAASVLVAARQFGTVVSPVVGTIITVGYYGGPIFFFELTMGCWLLLKGLRRSGTIDHGADSIRARVAGT